MCGYPVQCAAPSFANVCVYRFAEVRSRMGHAGSNKGSYRGVDSSRGNCTRARLYITTRILVYVYTTHLEELAREKQRPPRALYEA